MCIVLHFPHYTKIFVGCKLYVSQNPGVNCKHPDKKREKPGENKNFSEKPLSNSENRDIVIPQEKPLGIYIEKVIP